MTDVGESIADTLLEVPCPKCGARSCPFTLTTRKRTVYRCKGVGKI